MTKDRPNDTKREKQPGKPGKGRDTTPKEGDKADGERIAKRLARAGVASRRDAEAMIEAGRVAVNGRVLDSPAFNVSASDRILVDGEPLPAVERTRLFLFHKPGGVVTTNRDPEGRKTIFDALPEGLPRLITVGRLDINTEGL
ncbi:MAG: S4 domain-containing protein, partial [Nitratireductor sp.]